MRIPPDPPLDPEIIRDLVCRALAEDVGAGDITTAVTIDRKWSARGAIQSKEECVICGLDLATEAFRQLDPGVQVTAHKRDGAWCVRGDTVAEVRGNAGALLTAERTALNFLQRLSGIATITRRFVDATGGRITVLDTRKTTPMLRAVEKYAVRVGGGTNHRFGLEDGILIKDNHIRIAGGVGEALARAKSHAGDLLPVEIEAQSLDQVDEALGAGAGIILLDNLPLEDVREAVRRVAGRARLEISGGVTLDRVAALADTGADYVSVGALTHSAPSVDLSFEIERDA